MSRQRLSGCLCTWFYITSDWIVFTDRKQSLTTYWNLFLSIYIGEDFLQIALSPTVNTSAGLFPIYPDNPVSICIVLFEAPPSSVCLVFAPWRAGTQIYFCLFHLHIVITARKCKLTTCENRLRPLSTLQIITRSDVTNQNTHSNDITSLLGLQPTITSIIHQQADDSVKKISKSLVMLEPGMFVIFIINN